MAVTLDIGSLETIHPANKKDMGERLALWALANDYEKELVYSGPIPAETETENNQLIIRFDHTGGGLTIKENVPNQFEIAGKDGTFFPAEVNIEGDELRLSSPKVANPENVRYAYKNAADASLFNEAGLPAPSFTTEEKLNKKTPRNRIFSNKKAARKRLFYFYLKIAINYKSILSKSFMVIKEYS